MRQKEERCVITFHTTEASIAMEKAGREKGIPGRLIPVPQDLSAGCGFAWCSEPKWQEELIHLLDEKRIEYEAVVQRKV
ncbi:MAG: DUF3343 domain-containing protein [Lachnospiraceae bacterium]|nr:DUF3343 domain-containing protein [Lachnospiraceae bacterium]